MSKAEELQDEQKLAAFKAELASLHAQASNQYHLLREISSILHTVSSTLTSANQISAHEREALISRLESIDNEITQERRALMDTLARVERSVDNLGDEFDGQLVDMARRTDSITAQLSSLTPIISEVLRHSRATAGFDPSTGAEVSSSDKAFRFVMNALWSALATALVLYALAKLLPYIPTQPR